jgi:hypothetical protein
VTAIGDASFVPQAIGKPVVLATETIAYVCHEPYLAKPMNPFRNYNHYESVKPEKIAEYGLMRDVR